MNGLDEETSGDAHGLSRVVVFLLFLSVGFRPGLQEDDDQPRGDF